MCECIGLGAPRRMRLGKSQYTSIMQCFYGFGMHVTPSDAIRRRCLQVRVSFTHLAPLCARLLFGLNFGLLAGRRRKVRCAWA